MKYKRQLAILVLCFLLGIRDGHLALWKEGNSEPVEVFPFRVEMLPPADQARLKDGIRIKDPQQLAGLMEDFLS